MAQGIIRVARDIWEKDLGRPFANDEWHKALLLPENFQVVDVRCNPLLRGHDDHYVTVESEAIPESDIAGHPILTPFYVLEKDQALLDRIEIYPNRARIWSRFNTVWRH